MVWKVDGKVQKGNPADYHQQNGATIALYFVPKGADAAPPTACTALESIGDLNGASAVDKHSPCVASATTTTVAPGRYEHDRTVEHDNRAEHQQSMKAVVLVGGEGTRLRPLTYATPKPLLPIANQPFLERQLTVARVARCRRGGALPRLPAGRVRTALARREFGDLALRYVVEDHPLGTAGAIRFAAEGIDERVIVCNGDVLTTLDLDALVQFHEARGAEATIHLTEVGDPSAYGVVPTRDDGEVVAFVEKPPPGKAPTSWINAGTYVLEPSVLERIPERLTVSIERETFPRMLDEPGRLFAMASTDYWIDIGTPEKYLEAHRDVLGGAMGTPPAPGAQEREPGIWIQGRSTVDPSARLEAPSLIGDGVVVEGDARVAASVIGARCELGSGSRVVRSVLLEDVRLEPGAEVVDSIIGTGATIGATACVYDHSIVGPDVQFPDGGRASGARIAEPMMEKGG